MAIGGVSIVIRCKDIAGIVMNNIVCWDSALYIYTSEVSWFDTSRFGAKSLSVWNMAAMPVNLYAKWLGLTKVVMQALLSSGSTCLICGII